MGFPQSNIDWSKYMEGLSGKANRDEVTRLVFPSSKAITLSLGPHGTHYTAPADGYWYVNKMSKNIDHEYINIRKIDVSLRSEAMSSFKGQHLPVWYPSKKGDVVQIDYNASGDVLNFIFYYSEGSKE